MITNLKFYAGAAALVALAGCVEDTGGSTAGMPSIEEQACLRDVSRTTNNGDVQLVSSSFSQAGTEVIVAVGPTGRWRCIGYSDGTTGGIMSITDEGFL